LCLLHTISVILTKNLPNTSHKQYPQSKRLSVTTNKHEYAKSAGISDDYT